MKNKLKPINSTKKISSKLNKNKKETINAEKNIKRELSNDFLPVK